MQAFETIDREKGLLLLSLARATLAEALGGPTEPLPRPDWLLEPAACFVTLRLDGELRGCIGSMEAYRPLVEDLRANSRAAAFRDPRFPPLTAAELDRTILEVSLLSPLERLSCGSEQQVLDQLRPGIDGLLLEYEGHRGTFLPAVWKSLAEPRLFLSKLKSKAGLAEDFWSEKIDLRRYTTRTWSEREPTDRLD